MWPFRRKKLEPVNLAHLHFIGEQDGPSERELKASLGELFRKDSAVQAAYLAKAEVTEAAIPKQVVVLAIRRTTGESPALLDQIGDVFSRLFARTVHLDILFVSAAKEVEVAAVARRFYDSTR